MVKWIVPDKIPDIPRDTTLFCDIETEELYVKTRLVQVATDLSEEVIILDTDKIPEQDIKDWVKDYHTVWYKSSYDLGTLNMNTSKVDDLFYAVKTAYPEFQNFSLDEVTTKLGFDFLYQGLEKKDKQKKGFVKGAYLSQKQLQYAATDVHALKLMWRDGKIQAVINNNMAYKVDMLSQRYAIEYQQNGLPVNQECVKKESAKLVDDIARNYEILGDLNPNSSKQCVAVFGTKSSDKPTLIRLISEGNELAKAVFDQRRLLKRRKMLETYDFPRVVTKFDPAGAATGRFTAKGGDIPNGINAQQITRNLQYMFHTTDPEKVVLDSDYPTLELRVAAAVYGEHVMYKELMEGKDLHIEMAKLVTGKSEVTKEERNKAKAVNFGYVFGMSAKTFQEYAFVNYGVVFTLEEAEDIRNKYFAKYPTIKSYHTTVWNSIKRNNYTYTTALGRVVAPRIGTDAINGPVQGSGAEVTKLAVHYMVKEDPKTLNHIINVVHDAIYLEVYKVDSEYWSDLLSRCMVKAWEEISKTPLFKFKDIPMYVEIEEVGK